MLPVVDSRLVVIPTTKPKHMIPVDPGTIRCPYGYIHSIPEQYYKFSVTINRPEPIIDHKVAGTACYKFKLTTKCDEDLLFSKTIKNLKANSPISKEECLAAIRKSKTTPSIVEHLPASCSWMQTIEVSIEYIVTRDHPVGFDPYSSQFIDSLFVGGKTDLLETTTVFDSVYWIADEDSIGINCPPMEKVSGYVLAPDTWNERNMFDETVTLWSSLFRTKSFSNACRMKFCNVTGIRFSDGEWIDLEFTQDKDKGKAMWIKAIKICSPDTTISLASPYELEHHSVQTVLAIFFYSKCQDTVSKLRNKFSISPLDISYLAQSYPGPGPVYQITDHGLMTYYSFYKLCNISMYTVGSDKQTLLGYSLDGKTVESPEWTESGGLTHGPNGLILKNKQLLFPSLTDLRAEIEAELTQTIEIHEIKHLTLESFKNTINTSTVEYHHNPDRINVLEVTRTGIAQFSHWLSDTWGSMFHSTFNFTIVGFIILTLILLGYRLYKHKRRFNRPADIEILELQQIPQVIPRNRNRPIQRLNKRSDSNMYEDEENRMQHQEYSNYFG